LINNHENNKTKLTSVSYTIDTFFAGIKLGQVVAQGAEVMKAMNQAMNIKELNSAIGQMGREMEKMGIIQEMVSDAMDSMNDDVQVDNELEVDQIIFEA
jgi:charged multivesicular body protein 3